MSTRKRTQPTALSNDGPINPADLPTGRPRQKALRKVSPPLATLSLNKLIYIVSLGAFLFTAFYAYKAVQYTSQAGGVWNLVWGRRPPLEAGNPHIGGFGGKERGSDQDRASKGMEVEERINALAEALGMPPKELASAIAGAVKAYVPPASLSSVSSVAAKETGKSHEAVKVLLGEEEEETPGIAESVASGFGSVIGLDEPPEMA